MSAPQAGSSGGASAPEPAEREREQWTALLAYGLAVVVVLLLALHGRGTLADPEMLAISLRWVDDGDPWALGLETPFCYRPLFRWLVLLAYDLFTPGDRAGLYAAFALSSALSLLGAVGAFHALLLALGYAPRQALLGGLVFLSGFPAVFAHDVPVQVRGDFLGWAWIALTLLALVRGWFWPLVALGVVAPWIRETCLLGVLPVWWVSTRPRQEKAMAYLLPGLSLLAVRVVVQGIYPVRAEGSGYLWDLVVNSTAPARACPGEALLYLFATFGAVWLAAGLRLLEGPPWRHPLLAPRVAGLALLAVAISGWTMGMIRENRISYVLFPFVIPPALDLVLGARFREVLRSRLAWGAAALVLALGGAGLLWLRDDPGRVDQVRPWIGELFHLGVAPVWRPTPEQTIDLVWSLDKTTRELAPRDEVAARGILYASRLQGPHVLLHLAASAFLAAGWWATRRRPVAPSPAAPPEPARAPTPEGEAPRG